MHRAPIVRFWQACPGTVRLSYMYMGRKDIMRKRDVMRKPAVINAQIRIGVIA